jgi:two-component system, cell cycle sensor histidine kinase and response regulator CckA
MSASLRPSPPEAIDLFLRKVSEYTFSGVLLVDRSGTVLRASPSVTTLLGHDASEVEGHLCFTFIHPDDLNRARRRLEESVSHPGVPIRDTLRVKNKAGEWVDVEAIGVNRLDESDVNALVVTYHDVTGREALAQRLLSYKHTQQALRIASSELLESHDVQDVARRIVATAHAVFDASGAWVGESLPDGSVGTLAASEAIAAYVAAAGVRWDDTPLGHGPTGVAIRAGQTVICESLDDERYAPWRELAAAKGVACTAAFPLTSRRGTFGALNLYSTRAGFFAADKVALIEVYARQAGLALDNARLITSVRDSEARFRRLFEESRDAIFLATPDGRLQDANPALLELFGISQREVSATDTARFFADPADRDRLTAEIVSHGPVRDFEASMRRSDGTAIEAVITAALRRDDNGTISGIQGIVRDVTERKRIEERTRASQRLEAVGRLAGGVAHDYNNTLTAILGFATLLELRLTDDQDALTHLAEIRSAAERAAALTRQLLAFSRHQLLQPMRIDLNATLLDMTRLLRHMLGEDVRFALALHPDAMVVTVDPTQLEQVILNLAVNARQAMPKGGTLSMSTESREVEAAAGSGSTTVPAGQYVALVVRDTGVGIEPDVLKHIFEPFFTTKATGSGLGLATVYGIVRQSAGHIAVESTPGHGTVFTILLPRTPGLAESRLPAEPGEAVARGSEEVLVVDDQPSVLSVSRQILERHQYHVTIANDAESALTAARAGAGSIALLITDLVLPGVGGQEIARRMREIVPHLRVLFISGFAEQTSALLAPLGPSTAFLAKPFTAPQLLTAVRRLLDAQPS